MIEDGKHLDGEQIEWLVDEELAASEGASSVEAIEDARRHASTCAECRRLVTLHKRYAGAIHEMRVTEPFVEGGEVCPSQGALYAFVCNLLTAEESEQIFRHVVNCDHCGAMLKQASEVVNASMTPEEEGLISSLPSASRSEQAKLAGRLALLTATPSVGTESEIRYTKSPPPYRLPFWKMRWIQAFAALAVLLAVLVGWSSWNSSPERVNRLLAEAYSQERILEVRIPGAEYAPLHVQRGGESSRFSKPTSLLEAEGAISRQLSRHPNDLTWLGSKARAELLEGNYDSAIRTLEQSNDIRPDFQPLLTDLASAYFLRAQSTQNSGDYGKAIECLGKVLASVPDDRIALYNRALIYERTSLYTQAAEDWEHYLRIDSRTPWADEARRHLDAIKSKVKGHEISRRAPLLLPSEIANSVPETNSKAFALRFEDYLNLAITRWLPTTYSASTPITGSRAERAVALAELATTMMRDHRDPWLRDLLAGASSPNFAEASVRLSEAILANERADVGGAEHSASEALRLFDHNVHNRAGALLAQFELVVAANIGQDDISCSKRMAALQDSVTTHSYHWLGAQIRIEAGNCQWLAENLGSARKYYLDASDEAKSFEYKEIYLKAQDHLSGVDGESGQSQSSWEISQKGLEDFWSNGYPDVRGYNFYYELSELARAWDCPHLQVAAWREGIALNNFSTDVAQRAMAHSLLGVAAVNAEIPQLAEQEFLEADRLFSLAPQIESTRVARFEAETRLAQVEVSEGKAARAIERLKKIQLEIPEQSDKYLAILFYDALGAAEFRERNSREAFSALASAVELAELQLQSLDGERDRIAWEQHSGDAYRELVQLKLANNDISESLELWEWYRGSALRSGQKRQTAPHPFEPSALLRRSEVANQLPSLQTTTVISYALLPRGLAIWVFDDDGVTAQWLEVNPVLIRSEITRFREICSDRSSSLSALQSEARILYDQFIVPIEQRLHQGRTFVVELDDQLAGLPIDALVDPNGRYFGERAPIVTSLGLYYRSALRRFTSITPASPVLVVAVSNPRPTSDLTLTPLPDALLEGEMVGQAFQSARVLRNEAATADEIVSLLPKSEIFHFAGHAVSSLRLSGLMLSGSTLNVSALEKVSLPKMQLAVFSACNTQAGSKGNVDETDSLVRLFLRAGVPHVVASRWQIDSVATREFMRLFYRDMLQSRSVSEAIYAAKATLRSRPETAHPFYWSAFSTFGAS